MDPQKIWTRLEPHAREISLQYGVDAAVHDPLWLLARQWQLLEFWGEDAGSPVFAEVDMICSPITRYYPKLEGKLPSAPTMTGEPYDGTVPLETLVERERVPEERQHMPPLFLAAEAGLQFLRMLSANGAGDLSAKVIADFPLKALTEDQKKALDSDTLRFMQVMAGRVPDGTQLRTGVQSWSGIPQQYQKRVEDAITAWVTWYDTLAVQPSQSQDAAWVPQRLEYQALISAATPQGEVVLNASEYADGHLDWYSFNVLPAGSLGAKPNDATTIDEQHRTWNVIPTPVTFSGMPASRYWEFEDANVDFGAIAAGDQQLAHLLLLEFGLVSGDDWFVIPVVLPVGTLCVTNKLTIRDTFGDDLTFVKSVRAEDRNRSAALSPWDLFHISYERAPDVAPPQESLNALFLPPTLGRSLQGKPVEEVLFMRDEMANMVWAVERTVESALGRPFSRTEAFFRERKHKPLPSVGPQGSQTRLYRLASDVPIHWLPMLPVPINGSAAKLGRKVSGEGQGRIMRELRAINQPLYGEEVPREGVRISRAYQYARWTNGQTFLWMGRRNEVGRGEGSSGLVFDQLVPPSDDSKPSPP